MILMVTLDFQGVWVSKSKDVKQRYPLVNMAGKWIWQ